ncbi:MAG: hypothetical protein KAH14_00025 [Clostridiales bacterium]|nr:hypothetical protein [Clostridiales bacterium]
MNDYRISVRLNLEKLLHRKAFEILATIPNRKKSDFVVYAIITAREREKTIAEMEQVVKKAMNGMAIPKPKEESGMDMAMDYLESL